MSAPIATFVVDDEPLARQRVLRLLHSDPDINVVGTFGSPIDAAAHAQELAPQLLLLDIHMPELAASSWCSRWQYRACVPTSSS